MLVIAKVRGYFDGIREPGDKFNVPDGSKATWFEPVEKSKEAKEPVAKVKKEGEGSDEQK
ncbi:MAG: hypothetical protein ACRCT2_06165 [Plesiomonas shigelloides]